MPIYVVARSIFGDWLTPDLTKPFNITKPLCRIVLISPR